MAATDEALDVAGDGFGKGGQLGLVTLQGNRFAIAFGQSLESQDNLQGFNDGGIAPAGQG
jgi:hypothetical protein